MKELKLNGREQSILRGIESQGSTGQALMDHTHMSAEELCDQLNGMMESGFIEIYTPAHVQVMDPIKVEQFPTYLFDVNPAYAQELRKAVTRRFS